MTVIVQVQISCVRVELGRFVICVVFIRLCWFAIMLSVEISFIPTTDHSVSLYLSSSSLSLHPFPLQTLSIQVIFLSNKNFPHSLVFHFLTIFISLTVVSCFIHPPYP